MRQLCTDNKTCNTRLIITTIPLFKFKLIQLLRVLIANFFIHFTSWMLDLKNVGKQRQLKLNTSRNLEVFGIMIYFVRKKNRLASVLNFHLQTKWSVIRSLLMFDLSIHPWLLSKTDFLQIYFWQPHVGHKRIFTPTLTLKVSNIRPAVHI